MSHVLLIKPRLVDRLHLQQMDVLGPNPRRNQVALHPRLVLTAGVAEGTVGCPRSRQVEGGVTGAQRLCLSALNRLSPSLPGRVNERLGRSRFYTEWIFLHVEGHIRKQK